MLVPSDPPYEPTPRSPVVQPAPSSPVIQPAVTNGQNEVSIDRHSNSEPDEHVGCPRRSRKPPSWHKDYVVGTLYNT